LQIFDIDLDDPMKQVLTISVWDYNMIDLDDFMGEISLNLLNLPQSNLETCSQSMQQENPRHIKRHMPCYKRLSAKALWYPLNKITKDKKNSLTEKAFTIFSPHACFSTWLPLLG